LKGCNAQREKKADKKIGKIRKVEGAATRGVEGLGADRLRSEVRQKAERSEEGETFEHEVRGRARARNGHEDEHEHVGTSTSTRTSTSTSTSTHALTV